MKRQELHNMLSKQKYQIFTYGVTQVPLNRRMSKSVKFF